MIRQIETYSHLVYVILVKANDTGQVPLSLRITQRYLSTPIPWANARLDLLLLTPYPNSNMASLLASGPGYSFSKATNSAIAGNREHSFYP